MFIESQSIIQKFNLYNISWPKTSEETYHFADSC